MSTTRRAALGIGGALLVLGVPTGLGVLAAGQQTPGGVVADVTTITETVPITETATATVSETATVTAPPVTQTASVTATQTQTATTHQTSTATSRQTTTQTAVRTSTRVVPGPTTTRTLPGGQVVISVGPSVTETFTITPTPLFAITGGAVIPVAHNSAWSYWPFAAAILVLFAVTALVVWSGDRIPRGARHR